MQFTDEVDWDVIDFVVAGALLFGLGLLTSLAHRKVNSKEKKIAVIFLIVLVFILIYMELAVGIFGTPIAGS